MQCQDLWYVLLIVSSANKLMNGSVLIAYLFYRSLHFYIIYIQMSLCPEFERKICNTIRTSHPPSLHPYKPAVLYAVLFILYIHTYIYVDIYISPFLPFRIIFQQPLLYIIFVPPSLSKRYPHLRPPQCTRTIRIYARCHRP